MSLTTTLTAPVVGPDGTISVASATDWPLEQFRVAIGGEELLVYAGFGTTTWSVLRDQVAATGVAVLETFNDREGVGSWGRSADGYNWVSDESDAEANLAVSGNVGTMEMIAAGAARAPRLTGADEPANGEVRFRFMADKSAQGGPMAVRARIRVQNDPQQHHYWWRAILETDESVTLQMGKLATAGTFNIGSGVVPAGGWFPHEWYLMAVQAVGLNPTILRGKFWKESEGEPAAWDVTTSDTDAGLQTTEYGAIEARVNAAVSNLPVLFSFDDYTVSRVSEGHSHASGATVVLVEPWPLPIVVQAGLGLPYSAPPTGALYLDTTAQPRRLFMRVGAEWHPLRVDWQILAMPRLGGPFVSGAGLGDIGFNFTILGPMPVLGGATIPAPVVWPVPLLVAPSALGGAAIGEPSLLPGAVLVELDVLGRASIEEPTIS